MNTAGTEPIPRTFTPGRRQAKLAAFAASLLLASLGLWELSWPLTRLLNGTHAEAKVVAVLERRPGQPERRHIAGEAAAADPTRAAVFVCEVSFVDATGATRRATLNVATQIAPAYAVGDRLPISYSNGAGEPALAIRDWRTWAVGGFLAAAGLCFVIVSSSLLVAARRPIVIPAGSELP